MIFLSDIANTYVVYFNLNYERNVPSNITISCQQIAEIKGMCPNDVMKITFENALKLFKRIKL